MNCPEQGKHISLHGNVVNVPTYIKDTVAKLPRKFDENGTIPMKLRENYHTNTMSPIRH